MNPKAQSTLLALFPGTLTPKLTTFCEVDTNEFRSLLSDLQDYRRVALGDSFAVQKRVAQNGPLSRQTQWAQVAVQGIHRPPCTCTGTPQGPGYMFRFLDPLGRSRFSSWNLRDGVVNNVDISEIRYPRFPRLKTRNKAGKR